MAFQTDSVDNNTPLNDKFREDARENHQDSLLDCLMIICKLHNIITSRNALTAGLPLENDCLTPNIFPRAAQRAGLQARIQQRSLECISAISFPVIILLNNAQAAVLLGWDTQQRARLLSTDTQGGEITVDKALLAGDYSGQVIFIQHEYRARSDNAMLQTTSWFKETLAKRFYITAAVSSVLISLIALATPLFIMHVYDSILPSHATATLWPLAIGISIAFVFGFILKTLQELCLSRVRGKSDLTLSAALYERFMGMKIKLRPDRVGGVIQHFQEHQSVRDSLPSLILSALTTLPFTLFALLAISIIGGPLVFIALMVYPVALLIHGLMQKPLSAELQKTIRLSYDSQAMLVETLTGLEAIKVNNAQSQRQYQWEQVAQSLSQHQIKATLLASVAANFTRGLQQFAGVMMIVAGVYAVLEGHLSMGGLIACYLLQSSAMISMGLLSRLMTQYCRVKITKASIDNMLALEQETSRHEVALRRERLSGDIELQDVTFSYPQNQQAALKDISLQIVAGEKVGIIGRSGSGKSSLAKLLVSFYQPDSGMVLMDGIDMRQLDVNDIRHNIGYVSQDIHLFSGTLRENLLAGASYVDEETMIRAATLAGVHDFCRRHPSGYNMQVGERGMNLSGGQRQAVALARSLLLEPPVLLMDEPTSAMDNTGEDLIKKAIAPLLATKTLLLITHRASLLSLVDRLVVLDNGKIIADGPKESVIDALKKGQIHTSH